MRAELLPRLREDGEILVVEPSWLVEEIRQGRLAPDAEVQFLPWTGDVFQPAARIPALAAAWDAPYGRLTAWLLRRERAWLAIVIALAMLLFGLAQIDPRQLPASFADLLSGLPRRWATGFEPVLLDDRVLSPWTSLLVHAGRDHLMLNLAVVGYSGFRVERALGRMGYAIVAAAAVLTGGFFIAVADDLPVIGSSTLAFGLWGAQLVLGFRFGPHLPDRIQRYYGYGNLPVFGVLATATALADGVSQWGHLGGVFGGALAASFTAPRPWSRRGQPLVLAACLAGTMLLGPAIRLVPALAWGAATPVQLRSGLSLVVPARLLPDRWLRHGEGSPWANTLLGLPAWTTPSSSEEAVFCAMIRLDRDADPRELVARWAEVFDATAIPSPPPLGPGWTAYALELRSATGARSRLVEHHLQRGRWLARAGYLVRLDEDGRPNRRAALFERVLHTVEVGAPPSVELARRETRRVPDSSRAWLDLAAVLEDEMSWARADLAYQRAMALDDDLAGEAAARRLELWATAPEQFPPSDAPPWFQRWVEDWPDATSLQLDALWWAVAHGACDLAASRRDRILTWPAREQANAALASCEAPSVVLAP